MASTWTEADRDKLRAAIIALATGEAVQSITFDGPPRRSVTYHAQDLDKMRALLAEVERQVSKAPSHRLVRFDQGWRR